MIKKYITYLINDCYSEIDKEIAIYIQDELIENHYNIVMFSYITVNLWDFLDEYS